MALSANAGLGQSVIGWGPAVMMLESAVTNVIQVSAGANHGLGLLANGSVVGWGDNSFGQVDVPPSLNDATLIAAGNGFSLALRHDGRLVLWGLPLNIETNLLEAPTDLVGLSARSAHALGLRVDGTVVAWGQNLHGESDVPAGLNGVIAIAAGDNHSLALKSNGTVVAWGDNSFGQVDVPESLTGVVGIAAGANHSLAVKAGGSVVAWGDDHDGQSLVPEGLSNVVALAGGLQSSVALKSDGSLVSWGEEFRSAFPVEVAGTIAISGGNDVFLALTTNLPPILPALENRTLAAGTELVVTNTAIYAGQPPAPLTYWLVSAPEGASIDAEGVIRWKPTELQASSQDYYTILTEVVNPVARRRARNSLQVFMREPNAAPILPPQPDRQVADYSELIITNTAVDPNTPPNHLAYQLIEPPVGAMIDPWGIISWRPLRGLVPLTNVFTTVVVDDGVPPRRATNSFVVILPDTNTLPVFIHQPRSMAVGIGRDATLSVWATGAEPLEYQWQFMDENLPGANLPTLTFTNAQVSQSGPYRVIVSNRFGTVISATVQVSVQGVVAWGWSSYEILNPPPTVTNVVALSAGKVHNLALRADGTVVAWGNNSWGECDVPSNLGEVVAVAAGNSCSLALKSDGTVVGWGANTGGQLDVPAGLTDAKAIAVLQGSSFAVRSEGSVVGWGDSVLELPPDLTNVVAIAAGGAHNLALRGDGTLVAWGHFGGEIQPTFVPANLSNVIAIAAGITECLALRADGTVVAWSYDDWDQTTVRNIDAANVVAISTFGGHSLALREDGTVMQWGKLIGDIPQPMDLKNVVAIAAGGYQSLALLRDGSPHATVQPFDQTVPQKKPLKFVAKVVGSVDTSLQWQFNGSDIPGATEDSYSIAAAKLADAGEYSLVASNSFGSVVSRRAKLTVLPDGGNHSDPGTVRLRMSSSTNQTFQLQISGDVRADYIIETSAELQDWTAVQTNRPASMPSVFTISNDGSSSKFFRVRLRQPEN